MPSRSASLLLPLALTCSILSASSASAADKKPTAPMPWMNTKLSPDERADLLLRTLSLDEKIQLLHGTGDPHDGPPDPFAHDSNGGSGYVPGFPDKDIPGLQIIDSASGVCYSAGSGRYSTALPANIALASSWNTGLAERYGATIGHELRSLGYNMTLGGGVNLTREPRDGRTFEYQGEDPLLAGTMVGHLIGGVQSTHVIGHIKHFAVNDEESGRHAVSSEIGERAMRETDLLAFQIGIDIGHPGAVMCAYNRVNGTYACENDFLLKTVLKGEWQYPGFVISDWLATHSTVAASHAGLDQEQPDNVFFGPALKEAVEHGKVAQREVDDHAHRVLRTMFEAGIVDDPPQKQVPDVFKNARFAREVEQKSIVLLRNEEALLPLDAGRLQRILVVGRNANIGMISGGGSAQVDPPGGNAIGDIPAKERKQDWQKAVWFPDAPLDAVRDAAPSANVAFDDGTDLARVARAAAGADVVLVYAYQYMSEGVDLPTLALPDSQDALIRAVAKANPHTVVVLETGGPVLMPWIDQVGGVVETWFSGTSGAEAITDVLFGKVNPSAKLPVTFPLSDADLPHPQLAVPPVASQEDWSDEAKMSRKLLAGLPSYSIQYNEGLQVGYRWYDQQRKSVLFPFGFGLSYSSFAYSALDVQQGDTMRVTFQVKNTATRAGDEIAQVYAFMPEGIGEPPKRLIGWTTVHVDGGSEATVTVDIPKRRLAIFNEGEHRWTIPGGRYQISVGPNSRDLILKTTFNLPSTVLSR